MPEWCVFDLGGVCYRVTAQPGGPEGFCFMWSGSEVKGQGFELLFEADHRSTI